MAPTTSRSKDSTSSVTGAKPPWSHQGTAGSNGAVVGGTEVVVPEADESDEPPPQAASTAPPARARNSLRCSAAHPLIDAAP